MSPCDVRPGPFADWDSRVEDDSEHWLSEGLMVGLAATGKAFSFGLYSGGKYQDDPYFETSYTLAVIGREAGLAAVPVGKIASGAGKLALRGADAGLAKAETLILTSWARKINRLAPYADRNNSVAGTLMHHDLATKLRAVQENRWYGWTLSHLGAEESYMFHDSVKHGRRGSVRFDVIFEGSSWRQPRAWDYKFFGSLLTPAREQQLIRHGPGGLRQVIPILF